ncbi:glycosyltransferase [Antarcticibacterium arcticum]|uniref:Glycosyltransferase n=1 Tax=Antarcticibacterium arcticum TaxID=2585771 RepID=A0A5B8YI69_9FLAO|nr:glycosyltransferase [Antarcticibacterium arcticum]QED36527.1 glycosyltransferase [Antarcticibacterium arcticum]
MHKIRILHIIKSLGCGGAEMLLPETIKLHHQRFEFHVIYFLPWKNQMVETIEQAGGKVICFPASNNIKLLQQYPKVIEYCKSNKINLIHCHLPWSGFLGRIVHSNTKIPVIYTEHNIQERYHFATKLLNKLSFNSQSLALGVSGDVSQSILNNIKPKIPVQTLLNGVNTAHFKHDPKFNNEIRQSYNIPENSVVIGNIAVFREQKAIPDWLRAFKEILKNNPDVYGILVGAGPKEEEIKELVKNLNLEERLILTGLQTNTIAYFSAMDIFMMSSAFEGLPIALLEAMSSGCAIVSTRAGGVVEAIRDEKDGLLCEVGDWKCLALKCSLLIQDSGRRDNFQKAARERVIESFSLNTMVEKLEENYLKLANP